MKNWKVIPIEAQVQKDFAARYRIPEAAAQLFIRRGITKPEDLIWFLENETKYTHNPFLFNEMSDVVERINQAVTEGEKILVFGDRDMDGISSLTLLVSYLRELGGDVQWRMPLGDDPYGLSIAVIEQFAEQGGTLIITADCGITAVQETARAVDLGIDVIIIDHHNAPSELPEAVGIINPKVADSGYPFEGLSAGALSAKVVWALRFSRTALFEQEYCLINLRPGNDSLFFDALVIKNLVVVRRLSQIIASDPFQTVQSSIIPFIQGLPLFVYDWPSQKRFFEQIFGSAEIYVHDLAIDLWKAYPALATKSLVRILANSRAARYQEGTSEEIQGLFQLFLLFLAPQLTELEARYRDSLALVALSLVADMMPMINENRILVRLGLESLSKLPATSHGLQSILVELDLARKDVKIRDIGWKIAPLINSSGRMGRPDIALELLLAQDPSSCHHALKQLGDMNVERKRLGDAAWKRLYQEVSDGVKSHRGTWAIVRDDAIPRGITGILAGRFSREFNASIIVVAKVENAFVGSIRTAQGMGATWLLQSCSEFLTDFGGHDAAGGFFLPADNYTAFLQRLEQVLADWQGQGEPDLEVLIDIQCDVADLDEQCWDIPALFIPSGQEFESPVYLINNLKVASANHLGKDSRHLAIEFTGGKRPWPGVIWDGADRYGRDFKIGDRVDVIASLERNQFRSTITPQIIIQDIRVVG